jgi:osmoprotectant transport system substrate-binding protein
VAHLAAILAAVALVTSACTHTAPPAPGGSSRTITVGSFNFPESVVLAWVYGVALRAHGYEVRVLPDIGPREVVGPALGRGLVDLVPEYAGSALDFFTLGGTPSSHDAATTHAALARELSPRGLVPLTAAPAEDANAVVVTPATAQRFHLRTISDLTSLAPQLAFGGPPECPERPLCLIGLRSTYGLRFGAFVALDTDGPLTLSALLSGDVDVAQLSTTMPSIKADHLVVLRDDRGLQPAENVTPVVRRAVLGRYGPGFATVVDAVSARLGSSDLRDLNAGMMRNPEAAASEASRWLAAHGLI